MAGTMLSVGVVGFAAALVLGACGVGAAAAFSQRLAGAADAAALAAADAASGAVPGVPCERAGQIAATVDAQVVGCDLDGLIATVTLQAPFARLPVAASARAGPPPQR